MRSSRRAGFTLVELLVVVAIIAILAGITAVTLPRALERAKIASLTGTMNDLRTSLTEYYTTHNSYPPGYGYRSFATRDIPAADYGNFQANNIFWVSTLHAALGIYSAIDLYDNFSVGYSTKFTGGNSLELLEFSPIARTEGGQNVSLDPVNVELYNGSNLSQQVGAQLQQSARPLVYIPVNKAQFQRAKRYWTETGDFLAGTWNTSNTGLGKVIQDISFPPPNYDAYVLISVGPGGGSFGLLDSPPDSFFTNIEPRNVYHVLGLRAYFLATRDINANGRLDFHYEERRRGDEADYVGSPDVTPQMLQFYTQKFPGFDTSRIQFVNSLPSNDRFDGYGPFIYRSE